MRIVRPSEVVVDHPSFVAGSRQPVLSATIDEEATRRIVQAPEVVYTDACELPAGRSVPCPARRASLVPSRSARWSFLPRYLWPTAASRYGGPTGTDASRGCR